MSKNVPKGKGSIVILIRAGLHEQAGEDGFERALSACSAKTQTALRGDLSANGSYPETAIAELVSAAHDIIGEATFPGMVRDLAKRQATGALRFQLRLMSTPRQLSRNNHRLWQTLHDTGSVEVVHAADDRSHILTISDFTFPTIEYEQAFIEYHCGILEFSGAKNVRGTSEQVNATTYRQWYVWQ